MSASDQPVEMKAELGFIVDRNQGLTASFSSTFVVSDPEDARDKGVQMQQAITAFLAGYGESA